MCGSTNTSKLRAEHDVNSNLQNSVTLLSFEMETHLAQSESASGDGMRNKPFGCEVDDVAKCVSYY